MAAIFNTATFDASKLVTPSPVYTVSYDNTAMTSAQLSTLSSMIAEVKSATSTSDGNIVTSVNTFIDSVESKLVDFETGINSTIGANTTALINNLNTLKNYLTDNVDANTVLSFLENINEIKTVTNKVVDNLIKKINDYTGTTDFDLTGDNISPKSGVEILGAVSSNPSYVPVMANGNIKIYDVRYPEPKLMTVAADYASNIFISYRKVVAVPTVISVISDIPTFEATV